MELNILRVSSNKPQKTQNIRAVVPTQNIILCPRNTILLQTFTIAQLIKDLRASRRP